MVFNLGELGGTLFIHAILEITSHGTVTLTNLAKHISLVSLLLIGLSEGVLLVCPVLPVHLSVDLLLVMILQPVSFVLESLLQKNVLLAVLIHVLKQVNASLVFTTPLLFASVPLLFVLNLGELINHLLVGQLVGRSVLVVLLKLLDLTTTSQALFRLDLLHSLLALKSSIEKNLITVAIDLLGLLTELLLCGIVGDELEVTLTVQQELLVSVSLLLGFLDGPLLTEHGLFLRDQFLLLFTLN